MAADALGAEFSRAVKSLIRSPWHSLSVILVLALGIGACGAMFASLRSVLLAPMPYADNDRLVQVYNVYPKATSTIYGTLSIPDWLDRREQAPALEALMLYARSTVTLGRGGNADRLRAARVSASMFDTLGVYPAHGAVFEETAMRPGSDRVALIAHGLWRERFQSRSDVIGQTLALDGSSYRIIGIMPEGFYFPARETRLWIPFAITPQQRRGAERKDEFAQAVGRLRQGATIEQLNQQFDAIAARNLERVAADADLRSYLETTGLTGRAVGLREWRVRDIRARVLLLNAAVLVVFLIAVANASNLQLVRLLRRSNEWALCSALGAPRARLLRRQWAESLLLALVALPAGVFLAIAGIAAMRAVGIELGGPAAQSAHALALAPQVLGYMAAIAVVAGLLGALLPVRVFRSLKLGAIGASGRGIRGAGHELAAVQNGLVVVQSALAVLLLTGFALVVQGFDRLRSTDPGFATEGVAYALLELPVQRYPQPRDRIEFVSGLRAELAQRGWRQPVGLVSHLPLSGGDWNEPYAIRGRPRGAAEPPPDTHVRTANPEYLQVMGIGLRQGRWFGPQDHAEAPPVAVIDRYTAATMFPDGDAVGHRIRFVGNRANDGGWRDIVGVVDSVRHLGLERPVSNETVYIPYRQQPLPFFNLVAQAPDDVIGGNDFRPQLRAAVKALDPGLVETRRGTVTGLIERALGGSRTPMQLLLVFGVAALMLAALGVYSVVSFLTAGRTQELGLRRALGASDGRIAFDVLGRGLGLLSAGATLGVGAALLAAPWLAGQVGGVRAFDPTGYGVALAVLTAAGGLACALPAWRTIRIAPTEALRYE